MQKVLLCLVVFAALAGAANIKQLAGAANIRQPTFLARAMAAKSVRNIAF